MQPFTARVIEILRKIPEGQVMTYGQVAAMAGSPRAARQVVRILHSMSSRYQLPWHRVVNAQGQISIQDDAQRETQRLYLLGEGVEIGLMDTVNLEKHQLKSEEAGSE
ncbi:MGMT family protein [Paenibacillus sp. JX-17]|uniref:MGMT family protein n=1 Tax=Paenibacillus lacisoli TaxID=3064525 RepID=A0ABT9C9Q0_9BACL|nr:MGMT family protein [Paenibacillus sp. JX-17]MDO7905605.1 MGMT family protein [Paenibacillus sp. JX-17]